jgi:hypothetical protein
VQDIREERRFSRIKRHWRLTNLNGNRAIAGHGLLDALDEFLKHFDPNGPVEFKSSKRSTAGAPEVSRLSFRKMGHSNAKPRISEAKLKVKRLIRSVQFEEFGRVENRTPITTDELVKTNLVPAVNSRRGVFQQGGSPLNHRSVKVNTAPLLRQHNADPITP